MHCERWIPYFEKINNNVHFIEHHSKFSLQEINSYKKDGFVLWIGSLQYVPFLLDYIKKNTINYELRICSDLKNERAKNGAEKLCRELRLSMQISEDYNTTNGIKSYVWSEEVQRELMEQAKKIRDAISPDEVLYVVDAMVGQDAVRTAQAFQEGVGFDAIVLTKLDGDARGGAALSITQVTGKPIIFAATGEKVTDFDLFYPERMASRILGLGDIQTLAEQAKGAFDSDTAEKLESKFASGEDFTLDDFLAQLEAMKKMGSMTKLLGMLPGANSGAMKKQLEQFDEGELVKTQSIVQSMTPLERNDPKVLNGSRRSRIAKGSGREVSDVNSLVDRFSQAQKVMKQMRTGKGGMQLPPGMAMPPGMPKQPAPKVVNKKKSRSGNPAKRAIES